MARVAPSDGGMPESSAFDLADLHERTHVLIALYHQGESHLLQVTQALWSVLPEPRKASADALCQLVE